MPTVSFGVNAALLDALVLSVVSQESTYGYKITQDIRSVLDISESTLYPVLRRLQKDGCLETYDREFAGRNRRYYRVTPNGSARLEDCRAGWLEYAARVNELLFRGIGE